MAGFTFNLKKEYRFLQGSIESCMGLCGVVWGCIGEYKVYIGLYMVLWSCIGLYGVVWAYIGLI